MKFRITVGPEREPEVTAAMLQAGFEVDDEADLVVLETDRYASHLSVRNEAGDRLHLAVEEIVSIESFGHSVVVHSADASYQTGERLYQLCLTLDPQKFIRVSNSVIIQRSKVKKIIPSLSMKFVLVMADGSQVDVTRSYYNSFKSFLGI